LEFVALPLFCAGHIPVIGEWFALPLLKLGDSMVLRADVDLAIALSACPASTCNGGGTTKPLAYEVF
jgi:uncharacterized protein YcgI (DUF1989 family)